MHLQKLIKDEISLGCLNTTYWDLNKPIHRGNFYTIILRFLNIIFFGNMYNIDFHSKLYMIYFKQDDFNFLLFNSFLIGSNIPAAPVSGVYISKQIVFQDHVSNTSILMTELGCCHTLLRQKYVVPRLKSSVQKLKISTKILSADFSC